MQELCNHIYHPECMKAHFEMCISESKFPILCPEPSCKCEVSVNDIKKLVSSDMMDKYYERTLMMAIQAD